MAATGVVQVFHLGHSNKVDKGSALVGSSAGSQLTVDNSSTASGSRGLTVKGASTTTSALLATNSKGSAATFQTPTSVAPFVVDSSIQVPSLNASLLGGYDASYFLPMTGQAADSAKLGGQAPSYYLPATGQAADSAKLGGHAPSYYLPATGQAADSAELGGQAPSQYLTKGLSASSSVAVTLNKAQTLTTVLSAPATLVSGQYYADGSIMLVVASGDTVACVLTVNGNSVGQFATVGPVANETYETLPLAGSVNLPVGATLGAKCADYTSSASTSFYDGAITATLIHSDNTAARKVGAQKARTLPAPR